MSGLLISFPFILFIALGYASYCQTGAHAIGSEGLDKGQIIRVLPTGEFIIAGQTNSYNEDQDNRDMLLLKTDANANVIWVKTFGGQERETVNDFILTVDGGVLMAAEKYRPNSQEGEYLILLKTTGSGNMEWKKIFEEGGNETEGYSVKPTADGGYIVAGVMNKLTAVSGAFYNLKKESQSVYLLKVDRNGEKLWSKTFSSGDNDNVASTAISLQITSDGNFLIIGSTTKEAVNRERSEGDLGIIDKAAGRNLLLVKVSGGGNLIWAKEYEGNKITMGYDIVPARNGTFFISGVTNMSNSDNIDAFLGEIDLYGNILWSKTYGGPEYEAVSGLQQTPDGGAIISGLTRSFGGGLNDAFLIKTDTKGNLEWAKAYGGDKNEVANSVAVTDAGYVFTGDVASYSSEQTDVFLVQTDQEGNSNCHVFNAFFQVNNLQLSAKPLNRASMVPVDSEIKSPDYKRMNINTITERTHQTGKKNFCN